MNSKQTFEQFISLSKEYRILENEILHIEPHLNDARNMCLYCLSLASNDKYKKSYMNHFKHNYYPQYKGLKERYLIAIKEKEEFIKANFN